MDMRPTASTHSEVSLLIETIIALTRFSLLYYTSVILLHRPFNTAAIHHTTCRNAADSILKLLKFLESTFGFTKITYLMAYCIYTAASVVVQDARTGDTLAVDKIDTFIRALEGSCKTCPGVQRSLDLIRSNLAHPPQQSRTMRPEIPSHEYLPAFPHHQTEVFNSQVEMSGIIDFDPNWLLDSFPEDHVEPSSSSWFV